MLRRFIEPFIVVLVLAGYLVHPSPTGDPYPAAVLSEPVPDNGLNDSLPHYQYKKLEDSLKRIADLKKPWLSGFGSSWTFFSLGFARVSPHEGIRHGVPDSSLKDPGGSFFTIGNYRLASYARFDWAQSHPVLEYPESTDKQDETWQGRYARRPVAVRYRVTDKDANLGTVMIPITKNIVLFQVVFLVLFFLLVILLLYAVVIRPVHLLRSISKGQFFDPQHVKDLRLLGGTLIVMAFIPGLLSLLCGWIFRSEIPEELFIPAWNVFWAEKNLVFSGLIVLLLARAFQRGAVLETDHQSIV